MNFPRGDDNFSHLVLPQDPWDRIQHLVEANQELERKLNLVLSALVKQGELAALVEEFKAASVQQLTQLCDTMNLVVGVEWVGWSNDVRTFLKLAVLPRMKDRIMADELVERLDNLRTEGE